jgi:hypothetical protein
MLKPLNSIPLADAYKLITECPAVLVDGKYITIPNIYELKDSEENVFLNLTWELDGLVYELNFEEGDNLDVPVDGTIMCLLDVDAEDELDFTEIILLCEKNLEEFV